MKLEEIRKLFMEAEPEPAPAFGNLAMIKLPEVPKAAFQLGHGAPCHVIGDLATPGKMYVQVNEDITKYTTDSHQLWLAEVITKASAALGYAVPILGVSCSTFLDLDGEVGTGIRICADLSVRGGPVLSTTISATPEHAVLTIPPLERYATERVCADCFQPRDHVVHKLAREDSVYITNSEADQTAPGLVFREFDDEGLETCRLRGHKYTTLRITWQNLASNT